LLDQKIRLIEFFLGKGLEFCDLLWKNGFLSGFQLRLFMRKKSYLRENVVFYCFSY